VAQGELRAESRPGVPEGGSAGRRLAWAAVVVVAALLPQLGTLHAPFTLDDGPCIVSNPGIRDAGAFLDPAAWEALGARCGGRSRAFGLFTFALGFRAGGLDPLPWHLTNVAIHVAASLAVLWLGLLLSRTRIFARRPEGDSPAFDGGLVAFLAALLFAVHPLQTQAVTYLTQRFTSLATLLFVLAVALYVRARLPGPRSGRAMDYGAALGSGLLAMWTKEIAFTLPALVAAVEWMFLEGGARRRLGAVAPFLALLAAHLLAVYRTPAAVPVLGRSGAALQDIGGAGAPPWADYLLTQVPATLAYLRMLLLPVGQSIDHDFPIFTSVADPAVLGAALSLLALAGLAAWWLRLSLRAGETDAAGFRLAAFGVLWFFVTLSVEAVVPLSDVFVEHRAYLPSVGFFLACASLAVVLRDRMSRRSPAAARTVVPAVLVVVVALGAASFARNSVWASTASLWEDAARKAPAKVRPREWYVRELLDQGRLVDAEREMLDLVRLRPGSPKAHTMLGVVLARQGRFDEAVAEQRRALALAPGFAEAHYNLGLVWKTRGNLPAAESAYREAIRLDPRAADPHNDLGALLARQGRLSEAIPEFRAALALDPFHAGARANLATALGEQGARPSPR
jgi:Flp pilus assembly protein TadD